MKQGVKKIVKKLAPGVGRQYSELVADIKETRGTVNHIKLEVEKLKEDNRINELRSLLSKVEPYQPTYGLVGFIDAPARTSIDRCVAIEEYLNGKIRGKRFLDIGSSLGYLCFYFADRGAKAEGWEMNLGNAEASRAISRLNGIGIDIKTKWLNSESVKVIETNQYDVITVLSVFHHTIHHEGLEYTQKLVAELVNKTPLLIVELAKKGEDKQLFWDAAQPKNELEIFDLVKKDIKITKIGEFGNHLSKNTRPLYAIEQKKTVNIGAKQYVYNTLQTEAYDKSEAAIHSERRRYYFGDDFMIKEYVFERGKTGENATLVLNEVAQLLKTEGIPGVPKMIDYEIGDTSAKIVYKLIKGQLIQLTPKMSEGRLKTVYEDLKATLSALHEKGIFHNDVRTWNVMYDGKHAYLIDIAQASQDDYDHDLISLVWLMSALHRGMRESIEQSKRKLPDITEVPSFIKSDYEKIKKGAYKANEL